MSYHSISIGPHVFVEWETPTAQAIEHLQEELARCALEAHAPLNLLLVAPKRISRVSAEAREAFDRGIPSVLGLCRRMSLVLDVGGLRGVSIRAAAAGLLLVRGNHNKMFIYDSLEDAVRDSGAPALLLSQRLGTA